MAKILVVDDNLANCDLLADVLSQWGYEVAQAHQGKEVLPMVEAFRPDLVLLDIMLPDENGLQILKKLRLNHKTVLVPVIMVTATTTELDTVKGLELGADDYLS